MAGKMERPTNFNSRLCQAFLIFALQVGWFCYYLWILVFNCGKIFYMIMCFCINLAGYRNNYFKNECVKFI